jgi:tape measure domain-containing protein
VAEAVVRLRVDASGATRALNGVQNQTNKLQKSFNGLRTAISVTGITLIGRQAVRTSANFEKLNVRLRLLTKASGSFAKSQKIAADAQKAFGLSATEALEGVTDITARLAPLGTSVEDIRTVFFGFNTAAKLAGSSAQESSNAFRQLAQALGSGRLAGDEFRSVSEQVPTVLAPIAEELGVTIGQLKKLAADGKLTSDVVLRALGRVGNEGSGFLKQLLKNDPTQVFKNFTNATEDLSRAFGDQLRPVVEEVTKILTTLIIKVTEFINSPVGKAAMILTSIAFAAKGVAAILPVVAIGLQKVAFAGGLATIALNALPFVAIASAIGLVTTAIIDFIDKQKEKTRLIKEGSKSELKAAIESLKAERAKVASQKRGVAFQQERLDKLDEEIEKLRERLRLLNKSNEEQEEGKEKIDEQAEAAKKLKERFMEIGKAVEEGIVQNLTDAVMGTKTLAEAAINVLNQLKRKLIEVAIERAVAGIGDFIGNALGGIFGGGGRGGASRVSADSMRLGRAASKATGIPMNLKAGSFAEGGRPPVGRASLVGERGPELFVPSRAGTIIPNSSLGGKSVTNNIVVNVDASGTAVQGNDAEASQFGEQLAAAIQAELVNQQRTGGLLA